MYIVSYPKSGRTWLRCLIARYVQLLEPKVKLRKKERKKENMRTKREKVLQKVLASTPDSITFAHGHPFAESPDPPSIYKNDKVVFLERDIKDVVVSYYFHITKRKPHKKRWTIMPISEFIRSELGVEPIIEYNRRWKSFFEGKPNYKYITYETLHEDTAQVLTEVIKFWGEKQIIAEKINEAVNFCCFENMKALSMKSKLAILKPYNQEDNESFKFRRGKIGGYVDYLSEEDIDYINSLK